MSFYARFSASGALASLKELYLNSNSIGDDGLKALAEACASGAQDHLPSLYVGNNKCSQQSKDMLKTAMSKTNCSILEVKPRPKALEPLYLQACLTE